MRSVRFGPGQPLPEPAAALEGAVLARDVVVAGARWSKGRDDDVVAVTEAFRRAIRGREHADLVLTAGGGMTDPSDSFFGALAGLGAG